MIHLVCLTKTHNENDFRIWYEWYKNLRIDQIHILDNESPVDIKKYIRPTDTYKKIEGWANQWKLFTDILKETAKRVFIPLTVGGGIESLHDFDRVVKCGADKVSVNSGAIKNPSLVGQAAKLYGDQCVVLSVDIKRDGGRFMVYAKGGREKTGMEAIDWIKRCVEAGAGEVVVNSIDTDGVKNGFDLEMLEAVCNAVSVRVIASGGAGCIEDFVKLFKSLPRVDAGLAASIFHFGEVSIYDLKQEMARQGIPTRL